LGESITFTADASPPRRQAPEPKHSRETNNVARKVVGLDIGTTAVRAAEVSVRRGQVVLERIGQAGLPEGVVVDGEVVEPGAVAIAIKDLWRRTRISSRRVIIGVANQRVVVRLVGVRCCARSARWPGSARAPRPWSTWARGSPTWSSTTTGCCASCASC
jgi:hypothetical protein